MDLKSNCRVVSEHVEQNFLAASLVSSSALKWMASCPKAQILQVFKQSCNIVAADDSILSLVEASVEAGPFSVVIGPCDYRNGVTRRFFANLTEDLPVVIHKHSIAVGQSRIMVHMADSWNPYLEQTLVAARPLEEGLGLLRRMLEDASEPGSMIRSLRTGSQSPLARRASIAWQHISAGIGSGEDASFVTGAGLLSGLGIGLTPAGDDFLVGVMAALKTSMKGSEHTIKCIASSAIPGTSRLSAAWLEAAGRGEFGQVWHDLYQALAGGDQRLLQDIGRRFLSIGHTSGADGLTGFVLTMECLSRIERHQ